MISSSSIKKYIESDKKDFKIFPIKFTQTETEAISKLSITKKDYFDYYGDLNSLDFKNFFSKVGENDLKNIKVIEKIIKKVTRKVLSGASLEPKFGSGMDHFWMSVRVTMPNNLFDIPRWHYDGTYFSNIDEQAKFAMVLKGPGTLFIKKSKKVMESFDKIQDKLRKDLLELNKNLIGSSDFKTQFENQVKTDEKYRPIYAKELSKYKIKQLKNNQGVVFWGGKNNNTRALHSEPKMDQPRIFISILPGTKAMVKEREEKQKQFEKNFK